MSRQKAAQWLENQLKNGPIVISCAGVRIAEAKELGESEIVARAEKDGLHPDDVRAALDAAQLEIQASKQNRTDPHFYAIAFLTSAQAEHFNLQHEWIKQKVDAILRDAGTVE